MNTTITTKSEQGGNPDQQNHNPQLHRQNFRTQTQNLTQFFFTTPFPQCPTLSLSSFTMNRRIRASTKPVSCSSPPRSEPFHFHKYLKPGALAQIRDSRITAHRLNSLYLLSSSISLHRTSSPPSSNATAQQTPVNAFTDDIPCFSGRIYDPRYPQRKKLVAAKSVLFLNPIPNSVQDSLDSLSNDILLAH